MVDKNLFLYDLAIVAIFKNEARYLKEWIDYHLLAGVDHFYLYNNDSSDNYKEILAPYVDKNLVTLIDFPGEKMQYPAYNDAIDKYRFECRYMAFIDIDEFIYPKANCNIVEVIDEILLQAPNAAGLGINWQHFGSNGQETSDYSHGVLERFTRRAESDWICKNKHGIPYANFFIKSVVNPRYADSFPNPHYATFFKNMNLINSEGQVIHYAGICNVVNADKIVINHYYTKSHEEFIIKANRRSAYSGNNKSVEAFYIYDRNEVFDDGILKYRVTRAKNFSFESDNSRINRVINSLIKTLTQSHDSLVGKLETFLTCRAVAEKFQLKLGEHFAEEFALAWIYRISKSTKLTYTEVQMLLKALPKILSRPFHICKEINDLAQNCLIK